MTRGHGVLYLLALSYTGVTRIVLPILQDRTPALGLWIVAMIPDDYRAGGE